MFLIPSGGQVGKNQVFPISLKDFKSVNLLLSQNQEEKLPFYCTASYLTLFENLAV